MTKIVDFIPTFLLGPILTIVGYMSEECGWNLPMFKVKENSFGHVVLTNVGSMGMAAAFAPLPVHVRCEMLLCSGCVEKKAVVIDDKIEIRPMMSAVITFDHRYGDGAVCLRLYSILRDYIIDPEGFDINKYPDL